MCVCIYNITCTYVHEKITKNTYPLSLFFLITLHLQTKQKPLINGSWFSIWKHCSGLGFPQFLPYSSHSHILSIKPEKMFCFCLGF